MSKSWSFHHSKHLHMYLQKSYGSVLSSSIGIVCKGIRIGRYTSSTPCSFAASHNTLTQKLFHDGCKVHKTPLKRLRDERRKLQPRDILLTFSHQSPDVVSFPRKPASHVSQAAECWLQPGCCQHQSRQTIEGLATNTMICPNSGLETWVVPQEVCFLDELAAVDKMTFQMWRSCQR